ncbi:GGDEF domain-containing protein [Granulicella arctica]|uniref:Diguanylate cyclase (GGDEF)-like protein n=1 Tax=Granulicella arctica TaxID=940613 RepID=A0A7Y9PET7_9BACT|nr:GGDEF domain-containing protein [Granulicella arctica]NYF78374.1 diguanylate cyclase (GGDEF)-like protein [Granulicella arctica]
MAWTSLLVHYFIFILPRGDGFKDQVRVLIAIWALELCGFFFILAAGEAQTTRPHRTLILEMAVPVFLQSFLYAFDLDHYALRLAVALLLLVPGIHLLISPQHRTRPFNRLAIAIALLATVVVRFAKADPYFILQGMLCAIFLCAAYLIFAYAPKMTRGVSLMVAGLAVWALTYPLQAIDLMDVKEPLSRAVLDIPRLVVAAGMLLSVLDDYVGRTESLALHDPLTGLPNRRLFENRLDQAIEESRRTRTPVACLVIDVDNFKLINDTMGHPVGDGLLQALAKRLSWNLGPHDMLARTGGDEFTAILVEAADEYHVRFIAGAMMAAGCVPVSIEHHAIEVRISIGIAVSPQDAGDSSELHKAADDAMYRAKRQGGSVIAFADEEILPELHTL